MKMSTRSRYFIVILSQSYFQSRHCLFELCTIVNHSTKVNVLPIILDNAITVDKQTEYIAYWKIDSVRSVPQLKVSHMLPRPIWRKSFH